MSKAIGNMYDYYFTATDCKVFLRSRFTGKTVEVDQINGVGYDYKISSVPVYTIGKTSPAFFSEGNSLGQGVLVIPFIDEQYMKVMLEHIFGESTSASTPVNSAFNKKMSDKEFLNFKTSAIKSKTSNDMIDIASIFSLFDIMIYLDNSNAYFSNSPKAIILEDCKIVGENMDMSSQQDKITQIAYTFMFKTLKRDFIDG